MSSPLVMRRKVCSPGELAPRTAPSDRSRVSNSTVPPWRMKSVILDWARGDSDLARGSIGQ